jgi:nucleotide-binding universal stress UspA family protein
MYKRILIVVEPRPIARAAVSEGVAVAQAHGAEALFFALLPRYSVPVLDTPPFVIESPQAFQQAARANADRLLAAATVVADRAGVKSRSSHGGGEDDVHCIVDAARKRRCDLIVVASEGRNALMRLLTGSVIPGLITQAPMPVLVVKPRPRAKAGTRTAVAPLKTRRAVKPVAGTPRRHAARQPVETD